MDATPLARELGSTTELPDVRLDITGPGEESGTYASYIELVLEDIAGERGIDEVVTRPDYQASGDDNVTLQAVRGSDDALGWVGFAFAEAELRDARLELVHADARSTVLAARGGAGAPDRHHRELRDTATARRPRFPQVRVDVRVEHARPGPMLRAAAAPGALVVVGSHGHSGLRRLLLGSVSGAVLHAATGPVAVVPAHWPG